MLKLQPWLLMLGLMLVGVSIAGPDFQVTQATTRLVGETYVLRGRIVYRFSAEALEALEHGVPLTVQVQIRVRPKPSWVWENSLVDERVRLRIRYKPLTSTYTVSRLPGNGRTYISREAALVALGELGDVPLFNRERLDPNRRYEVQLRVTLDIEELPLPLRPMAYLHPSWNLSSDWIKWPLQP